MKKLSKTILCLLMVFSVACNKEDQAELARLQQLKEEMEASASQMSEAGETVSPDYSFTLDQEYYSIDAAGSVTVHYTLQKPSTLEVSAGNGWNATVNPSGDTEGDIIVSAPDPASPEVIVAKATSANGLVTEMALPIMLRKPYNEADHGRIEVLAYYGFNNALSTLENFQRLAEAGVTMITMEFYDDWRLQLRLAEQTGVKGILFVNYYAGRYAEDPSYKGLDDIINEAKEYPAIYAYQTYDEPAATAISYIKPGKERIEELDPDHPVYVNLHSAAVSSAGLMTDTYENYIDYFIKDCGVKFITFDQYPVYQEGVQASWYKSLEVVRNATREAGIPFWAFTLCCREQLRADPTVENMRLQGNINIAYGAQCIEYFVWRNTSGTDYAPLMSDGTYTKAYDDCKTYNRELHNWEFIFAGADVWKVRHTGIDSYRYGTYLSASDYPEAISDITAKGNALVSFVNKDGNEYVAICNKSWQEKLSVDVTLEQRVFAIDRDGNFAEYLPGKEGFVIDEGDMAVIKWK